MENKNICLFCKHHIDEHSKYLECPNHDETGLYFHPHNQQELFKNQTDKYAIHQNIIQLWLQLKPLKNQVEILMHRNDDYLKLSYELKKIETEISEDSKKILEYKRLFFNYL
jgi:hypothetical protein